jgi:hypothetical protein
MNRIVAARLASVTRPSDNLCREPDNRGRDEMNAFLDAAVQLLQLMAILVLIAMNIGIGKRLKAIEEKLGR